VELPDDNVSSSDLEFTLHVTGHIIIRTLNAACAYVLNFTSSSYHVIICSTVHAAVYCKLCHCCDVNWEKLILISCQKQTILTSWFGDGTNTTVAVVIVGTCDIWIRKESKETTEHLAFLQKTKVRWDLFMYIYLIVLICYLRLRTDLVVVSCNIWVSTLQFCKSVDFHKP